MSLAVASWSYPCSHPGAWLCAPESGCLGASFCSMAPPLGLHVLVAGHGGGRSTHFCLLVIVASSSRTGFDSRLRLVWHCVQAGDTPLTLLLKHNGTSVTAVQGTGAGAGQKADGSGAKKRRAAAVSFNSMQLLLRQHMEMRVRLKVRAWEEQCKDSWPGC